MQIIAAPEFLAGVRARAGLLHQGLEALVAAHPDVFEEVRGIGFMLGLKCKAPNMDVVNAAYDALLCTVPAADNVVRLLPPLTIDADEITEALARLDRAAQTLSSSG